ncbi:hypothetical protein ACWEOZ_24440 [Actinoplanes sp. NPDC004185]
MITLIARAATDDWEALDELEQIARADPAVLRPHLRELLDRGLLWPPVLFAAADEGAVQEIITRIDGGDERLGHLLLILAEVRSASAATAFRRWQDSPPSGMDRLHIDALAYARQGGWDLRPDGTNHELCGPVAYELLMVDTEEAEADGDNVCPWCASPIWTVLDFDTADPDVARALAHTGWSGRLRITTCFLCTNYTTLFTDVTPEGGAVWSACNERPDYLRTSTEEPPPMLPELGPMRASPRLASAGDEGGSTLGGVPDWIQDAEYPQCPSCGMTMDYIGLVGGADMGWGEGADYIFLHAGCRIAAVTYQQS